MRRRLLISFVVVLGGIVYFLLAHYEPQVAAIAALGYIAFILTIAVAAFLW
jgi:hypothetical protein